MYSIYFSCETPNLEEGMICIYWTLFSQTKQKPTLFYQEAMIDPDMTKLREFSSFWEDVRAIMIWVKLTNTLLGVCITRTIIYYMEKLMIN